MRPLPLLLILPLLSACTPSNDSGKLNRPPTVFDQLSPDPRSDDVKVADFVIQLEKKYKRSDARNSIDLHFMANGPRRIKLRLTYDRLGDPTLASSIADSAMELAKRLKREDPSVRNIEIGFDREVVRREE